MPANVNADMRARHMVAALMSVSLCSVPTQEHQHRQVVSSAPNAGSTRNPAESVAALLVVLGIRIVGARAT